MMIMKTTGKYTKISLLVLAAAAILLAGCLEQYRGIRFSHKLHAAEAECADCHTGGQRAGEDKCTSCHEIDRSAPGEACLLCHTDEQYEVAAKDEGSYGDVIFDHGVHEGEACDKCHAGAETSSGAGGLLPSMTLCVSCHDEAGAPEDCSACHEKLDAATAPESHDRGWTKLHGAYSKADDSCAYCHSDNYCSDCHSTRRPQSHRGGWAKSGHGVSADLDRKACAVCHQADECSRCHSLKPSSHFGAGFRLPFNGGGHGALVKNRGGSRSCSVCHESSYCAACHN